MFRAWVSLPELLLLAQVGVAIHGGWQQLQGRVIGAQPL